MVNGNTSVPVPYDGGFALIGNADCGDVLCGCADHIHCFHGDTELACPNFVGIMLYPARLREILCEFPLRHAADFAFFVE